MTFAGAAVLAVDTTPTANASPNAPWGEPVNSMATSGSATEVGVHRIPRPIAPVVASIDLQGGFRRWRQVLAVAVSLALRLSFETPLMAQTESGTPDFGEEVVVRTGFVRVTLPAGVGKPDAGTFEVRWKHRPQNVTRVLGGADAPLEVGIAVDQSASMVEALVPLREALATFVDEWTTERDRIFVAAFSDSLLPIAEGRRDAAPVLASLPVRPQTGQRPTALFASLLQMLPSFENSDARTALIVASDGCDTAPDVATQPGAAGAPGIASRPDRSTATRVAQLAKDLAIPVYLVRPERGPCRKASCVIDRTGRWDCTSQSPPRIEHFGSPDPHDRRARSMGISHDPSVREPTYERDRFAGLISRGGGAAFVAPTPEDWQRVLGRIFQDLDRQWTIVFERDADEVKSSEVQVYATFAGKRTRLR